MSVLNLIEKSVTRRRATSPNVLQYANGKRKNGTFNDVTIEVDTDMIAANRLILSCCSRFFEGMFDLEMKEKYRDPVQINGFDGKAVKTLIDFMYSGEITIKNENVMDLLAASDYLQVGEVKQFCFDFLESILSSDNWFAIRSAADLYQNEHLQNQVAEYMSKNFDAVIETDEFKSLDKDGVCAFIENIDRSHVMEESIFKGLIIWCQVDNLSRKIDFPELFVKLIKLDAMEGENLEETVLKEDLVIENKYCLKVLAQSVCQQRKNFGATKIVSFGGRDVNGKCIEIYRCANKSSQQYPDLPIRLYGHCALMSNNYIYCIGGSANYRNGKPIGSKNVWRMNINDPAFEWKEVAPLSEERFLMGGTLFCEVLTVAGGSGKKSYLSSVEFYQAAVNEWKNGYPLQEPRSCCSLIASDQHLYVLGGSATGTYLSSVERTGNLKEQWHQVQSMQIPRKWFAAIYCNGFIYAVGGKCDDDTTTNTVEKYDVDKDEWTYVSSMNTQRRSHAACVMNGKIFVVGGLDASGEAVKAIECYFPATDCWRVVGTIDEKLFHHAVVAL